MEEFIKVGVTFPKENVRLPKNWNKLTESIYKGEKNFAVLTGKVNDIIVIDIDKKEDTFVGYEWFKENIGKLNEINTLVTGTVNGGFHIYFKYNIRIKNTINAGGIYIDYLSNNKCCYQGEMYDVINNENIRELTEEEINKLCNLAEKQLVFKGESDIDYDDGIILTEKDVHDNSFINNNGELEFDEKAIDKLNKLFKKPTNTKWGITKLENGTIKAFPLCYICLLNPAKRHSQKGHSAIFVNTDKSVYKTCHSCGTTQMTGNDCKKVINILLVGKVEDTVYQQLQSDLISYVKKFSYKRERNTGDIYKRIKSYAYEKYKSCDEFINEVFIGDNQFYSLPNNIDNLEKFIKRYDHHDFYFLEYNNNYIGFSNGVLNIITLEFINQEDVDKNLVVRKYINNDFNYSMETPLMDSVLDFQFNNEVRDFIYACLGRMFNIRDNLGFMLYLLGEAGCGKSLIIDVLCECFNNVGSINESYEVKYGLASLYEKDIIVCDDLPKNISQIFPQQTFQSCITGGMVSTAVKNKDALQIKWNVPMLWAGNWFPDYLDKGNISRRLLTANFEKIVTKPNPSLKDNIVKYELPALIYKCLKYYKEILLKDANVKGIWNICPEYFKDQKEELKIERNPLYKFLIENTCYKEGNVIIMEEIKNNFSSWLGKSVYKLDIGTFIQVNESYETFSLKVCKHCNKEHKKGCCEKYNRTDRTTKKMIRNIEILNN